VKPGGFAGQNVGVELIVKPWSKVKSSNAPHFQWAGDRIGNQGIEAN
jgi:hypothetical protein